VYEKGHLLKALAEEFSNFPFIRKEAFEAQNPVLSTYGIEAMGEMRKAARFPEKLKKPFNEVLRQAIASKDVALIGTAATLLREPALDLKKAFPKTDFLKAAQARLVLPRDYEAWNELSLTIKYLTPEDKAKPAAKGKSGDTSLPRASGTIKPDSTYHAINWQLIEKLPRNQRIRVITPKGKITLELLVEDAPGSVAMFVEQVRKGFYNGRSFHRIVPNFVAQGGCPRGDGWGSLDYNIRSEFNPGRYAEGALGLASAGKDTESCQWFFTHLPTPHLEGRYTLFARVVDGMDVVHQLELGDVMTKVEEVY
jgi:cyclophilin family peptidyl-prolyl cis-trans isomerase